MVKIDQKCKPHELITRGEGNRDGHDVPECPDGDDCNEEEDKESPSGVDEQKEEDVNDTMPPARCVPATGSLPWTIIEEMEEMFLRLWFSQTVVRKLVVDQGIDSP